MVFVERRMAETGERVVGFMDLELHYRILNAFNTNLFKVDYMPLFVNFHVHREIKRKPKLSIGGEKHMRYN